MFEALAAVRSKLSLHELFGKRGPNDKRSDDDDDDFGSPSAPAVVTFLFGKPGMGPALA